MELMSSLFAGPHDGTVFAKLVRRVFSDTGLCSIASVAPSGEAYANSAYYAVNEDLVLYILTSPKSVHAANWVTNPSTAITVCDSNQAWDKPHRGLQLFGDANRVPDSGHASVFAHYVSVHPGLNSWAQNADALLSTLESRFYAIRIHRLKMVDEAETGEEAIEATVNRGQATETSIGSAT
jgi:uncharacterized protein YhbP (UPF0306 family)